MTTIETIFIPPTPGQWWAWKGPSSSGGGVYVAYDPENSGGREVLDQPGDTCLIETDATWQWSLPFRG